MKLSLLLFQTDYTVINGNTDIEISSVVYDTRKEIIPSSLFICIKGYSFDGHSYIPEAVNAGASAIIISSSFVITNELKDILNNVTVISVPDTVITFADVSSMWFNEPSKKLTLIGITGTKGKTTTSHMVKYILEASGHKTGMIGTAGAFIGDMSFPTYNTTPEAYELHRLFNIMVENGCTHVVMEVSSQALKLKRTAGIVFDYAMFLNISPDHIGGNEHADFDEYFACKSMLFDQCKVAIINNDIDNITDIIKKAPVSYTVSDKSTADYKLNNMSNIWNEGLLGSSFTVSFSNYKKTNTYTLSMPGRYNAKNALFAIALSDIMNLPYEAINKALTNTYVKGRSQIIQADCLNATFVIDYAHNAVSTESILNMLKAYNPKRIICLFGCGGNRPKGRRHDMGEIAGKYADLSILTMDNPRNEELSDIYADIIKGLNIHGGKYVIIDDREQAIKFAIENTNKGDIVAMLGKGHEEYQEIKGNRYFFSEEAVLREYIENH